MCIRDRRSIAIDFRVKILPRILVIPANDHGIMVRRLRPNIAVGVFLLIIMNGLALLVRHGSVKGALYASVLQNGPLNLFIIFSRDVYKRQGRNAA